MFVHVRGEHLITNLVALILVGVMAHELGFSSAKILGVFFSVSILSILPLLLLTPAQFVGASASIYGLLGAGVVELRRRGILPLTLLGLLTLVILASSGADIATLSLLAATLMLAAHTIALFLGAIYQIETSKSRP